MIDPNFLNKWFTGKALVNAQEAVALLNESIALGYWAPKASVKVPAALGKSNVAKKLSESSAEVTSLEKVYGDSRVAEAWELKHCLYFGSFERMTKLDFAPLLAVVKTEEARNLIAKGEEFALDFAPVVAAIAKLTKESEANKKLAKGDGKNAMGICACCFRAQKVKPDGLMFQHGYERPGYGYIVGGCPGSMFKPYAM